MSTFWGNRSEKEERSFWSRSPEFPTLIRGKLDVDNSLPIDKNLYMRNQNNAAVLHAWGSVEGPNGPSRHGVPSRAYYKFDQSFN